MRLRKATRPAELKLAGNRIRVQRDCADEAAPG